jgi:hypothetical protein
MSVGVAFLTKDKFRFSVIRKIFTNKSISATKKTLLLKYILSFLSNQTLIAKATA